MSFKEEFNEFADKCHQASYNAGWWHDEDGTELIDNKYVHVTKMMLINSELVEMMEGHRKGLMDDKLPHRTMEEVEAADVLIRLADYAKARGLDIAGAAEEKMAFNIVREDHQVVNRRKPGGKKY